MSEKKKWAINLGQVIQILLFLGLISGGYFKLKSDVALNCERISKLEESNREQRKEYKEIINMLTELKVDVAKLEN